MTPSRPPNNYPFSVCLIVTATFFLVSFHSRVFFSVFLFLLVRRQGDVTEEDDDRIILMAGSFPKSGVRFVTVILKIIKN
jgi:hypothetical protein